MTTWADHLESGAYRQAFSALAVDTPHGVGHCCLGVLERAEGIEFTPYSKDTTTMSGPCGETTEPTGAMVEKFDLDITVTPGEDDAIADIIEDMFPEYAAPRTAEMTRMSALMGLNDNLRSGFEPIARVLRELGWDRKVSQPVPEVAEVG